MVGQPTDKEELLLRQLRQINTLGFKAFKETRDLPRNREIDTDILDYDEEKLEELENLVSDAQETVEALKGEAK